MMRAGWMLAGAALLLAGCEREDGSAPVADATGGNAMTGVPTASAPVVADETAAQQQEEGAREFFPGTWTGPEGLAFVVTAKPDGTGYRIRNRDTLDTEVTFDAVRTGDRLAFVRRGQPQTARPGTGAETGFKWLANKRDCLIVETGVEGYCRD